MNSFVTVRVACAACGIVKGEANHWFCLVVQPEDEMAWTRYGVPILYAITSLNPDVPPRGVRTNFQYVGKVASTNCKANCFRGRIWRHEIYRSKYASRSS